MRLRHAGERRLLVWLLVLAAASTLTLFSTENCVSAQSERPGGVAATRGSEPADAPTRAVPAGASPAVACAQAGEFGPEGPAATFTEKPFWIVLGLVVLGWLVLAADNPAELR